MRVADEKNRPIDAVAYKGVDFRDRAERADATCRCLFPVLIILACCLALGPILNSLGDTFDVGDIE